MVGKALSRCNSAPGEADGASGRLAAAGCSGGAEHPAGSPDQGSPSHGRVMLGALGVLSGLSTQPTRASPASAPRDQPLASPALRSSASPGKIPGIAHRLCQSQQPKHPADLLS